MISSRCTVGEIARPFQIRRASVQPNPYNRQTTDKARQDTISCCTHIAHGVPQLIEFIREPVQSIMGAQEYLAAAVAAFSDIVCSPMVRNPVIATMMDTYGTGVGAVRSPRVKTGIGGGGFARQRSIAPPQPLDSDYQRLSDHRFSEALISAPTGTRSCEAASRASRPTQ